MPVIPDYFCPALQELPPLKRRGLQLARLCGATPLVSGIITFLLWLPTRSSALENLGGGIILVGCFLFCVGVVALLTHVAQNWHRLRRASDRFEEWKDIVLAVLLLIFNFPVCWFILLVVVAIKPVKFTD